MSRPHRALHPHMRYMVKSGIGLLNSTGWRQADVIEVESVQASGRPVFYQFGIGGERGLLVNAYVPKAWSITTRM